MAAIELDKLKGDKKMKSSQILARTFKYIKPELGWFILAFVLLCGCVVSEILFAEVMKWVINYVKTPSMALNIIIGVACGYFGLIVIGQVFSYLEEMILQRAGQRIIYKIRMEVFEHIENMSQNQFNEMPVGSLVTRVANYTTALSDLFTNTLVMIVKNVLTIIVVFVLLMVNCPQLGWISTAVFVVIFIISYIFRVIVTKVFRKERALESDMNTFLNESLSGMKITQIFNQEDRKDEEFCRKNNAILKNRNNIMFCYGIYRPTVSFLAHLATALVFVYGIKFGLNDAELVAYYLLLNRFFNPIQTLADQLNNIQKAKTSSERLFNLLDVKPEVVDDEDAIEIEHFDGEIEFKNVWFAYENEDWILKDVSFVIEPKTTAAFVGATGAGKTTILGLIVRNYEIQKGQILIDGIDIKKIKVESLRKAIGQMLQDVFLFTGTVKDNITLHDDSFTYDEVREAATYVNADTFIDKTEKGLDEIVIERGENFSQGQRQLLSFARTVIHKPQILILDEATANIDTETEVLIQESLEKMKSIGTMLVVAHRLSTIQRADKIIVLQHGEIIEFGNHQELLKKHGYYYKLYKVQFEQN